MDRGIEGTVELVAELDRLSATSSVAAQAPRSTALYQYLGDGMSPQARLVDPGADLFTQLAGALIERLGIWWSSAAYGVMPVMTPWCVRDRSCRYDQGPESWGAPRDDAFLRDDNSIIKKLPLPVRVSAAPGHPYDGRKPWRGFTACHIWRDLPDGAVAGEDPWLYSFMPNLVWLPSWLAPLTDRHDSHVQHMLKRESYRRFRDAPVGPSVAQYAERGWARLAPPPPGPVFSQGDVPEFRPNRAFFRRRLAYLTKFVEGCDAVVATGHMSKKLICTRYTEGLPALQPAAVSAFATEMREYRDASQAAVVTALGA